MSQKINYIEFIECGTIDYFSVSFRYFLKRRILKIYFLVKILVVIIKKLIFFTLKCEYKLIMNILLRDKNMV